MERQGDNGGPPGIGEDGGNGGEWPGSTRAMSHNINLAGSEGPSAPTIVPYSPSSPYPPGHSPSKR